jgi:hypothetical protein
MRLDGPSRLDKKVIHHAQKSVTAPSGVYL